MCRNKQVVASLALLATVSLTVGPVFAGEQGHYVAAPMAVRDYVMPPKGFYAVPYNTYYNADKMIDSSGDTLDSISSTGTSTRNFSLGNHSFPVKVTGTLNADVNLNIHSGTQTLVLVWATDKKFLGADYSALLVPSWGYMSANVRVKANAAGTVEALGTTKTFAANQEVAIKDDVTGFGDLMVEPLWLMWRGKNYDLGFSYTATLPTGTYDKDSVANIGFGFCSQRLQANGYFYPFESKATALMFTPTWEWNSKKIDKNVQPGQTLTIEYGISQYLHPRVELGISGYNQWQVTDDSGSAASDNGKKDTVSGVGGQVTYWVKEKKCALTAKVSKEYRAKDRLEGTFYSLNGVWIF